MAWLPALVVLLFAVRAGSFVGGASFAGAASGAAALLALAVWGAGRGAAVLDPLRLGRAGRWLLLALMMAVAASWWTSPVPRAGRVATMLLPAFLLLPAVVERCWSGERRRRLGLRGLAAVTALIALWALAHHLSGASPRASEPLGHHNLLAVWLLALLPSSVLPWRENGRWRWLGVVAGGPGAAAVVASRSLLGMLGLVWLSAVALVLTPWAATVDRDTSPRRRWRWLAAAGAAAAALLLAAPRLAAILAGRDPSALARAVYWRAGWEGWAERPLLGWGPGSTPWLVSGFLDPRPGVNPPGEIVGQLHSLPLQLAFELGVAGLLLAAGVVGVFARRRWTEVRRGEAADPGLTLAGLTGLGAAGFALLGSASLGVTAVPVALAAAAGLSLAGAPRRVQEARSRVVAPRVAAVAVYVCAALVVLTPLARAQLHYERSLALEADAASRELAAAVALDPRFPHYRAWLTWIGGSGPMGRRVAAEPALAAARDGVGVGPLWLMAGVYGVEAGSSWAGEALETACRLDPLAPLAPMYRVILEPAAAEAPGWAARALLAEPRLLAATFWKDREELLDAALAEIEARPDVDPGWRAELLATAARLEAIPRREERRDDLFWEMDASGAESLSLHLFRRLPRTARLAPVAVDRERAERIRLPAATSLPGLSPGALAARGCGLSAVD